MFFNYISCKHALFKQEHKKSATIMHSCSPVLLLFYSSVLLKVLYIRKDVCQYSPSGVWLYCAIATLLPDLPAELTTCTAITGKNCDFTKFIKT